MNLKDEGRVYEMNVQELRDLAAEGYEAQVDKTINGLEEVMWEHARLGDTMIYIMNTPFHKYSYLLNRMPVDRVDLIQSHFEDLGFEIKITLSSEGRIESLYISWGLSNESKK